MKLTVILEDNIVIVKLPKVITKRYILNINLYLSKLNEEQKIFLKYNIVYDATSSLELAIDSRKIITDFVANLDYFQTVYLIDPQNKLQTFTSVLKLINPNFNIYIVEDIFAVKQLIDINGEQFIEEKKIVKQWHFHSNDHRFYYNIQFIEPDIFISKPAGIINVDDAYKANELYNLAVKEIGINKYYRIQDYSRIESVSIPARKVFLDWLVNQMDNIKLLIFINTNKTMELAIRFSKSLNNKFDKAVLGKDISDAFAIIEKYRHNGHAELIDLQNKIEIPSDEKGKINLINELYNQIIEKQLERTHELKTVFELIARISWDNLFEIECEETIDPEFLTVINAVKVVHQDIRQLFIQKETHDNELKAKDDQFTVLLENMPNIAIYGMDLSGRIKYWNAAAEKIYGIKRDEIVDQIIQNHPNFKPYYNDIIELLLKASQQKNSISIQNPKSYTYINTSGESFYLLGTSIFIKTETKEFVYRIDVDQTIQIKTEHELLEHRNNLEKLVEDKIEKIKTQELQFRTILEHASQGVFVTQKFDFKYINPKGIDFFGCSEDELYRHQFLDFVDDDQKNILIQRSEDNENFGTVLKIKNAIGNYRWVELSSVPVEWDGKPSTLNYIVDITIHKNTEDQLLLAKQKAEEADRLKSSFLANMSHEIRTPLNAIIGFSQLISQDQIPSDLRQKYFNLIDSNSKQLLDLIDDIIDIAKIESGQITINKTYFNVNDFLKHIYSGFKEQLLQSDKSNNIKLQLKLPIKSDSNFINTDKQRVTQVVNNLLHNALKFTHKGSIIIGYRVIDRFSLEFYVKDSGIGIHKDKQDVIFNRFHQLNSMKTAKTKGTGLGLAISKNILELLGGQIHVESEFGKGSTFIFDLPFKSDFEEQTIIKVRKNIPALLNWSDKCILLAEDEESNYLFIKEALRRTKAELIWVENGKEAIEILKSEKIINLVLMDIQMPVMTGYEAIQVIKSEEIDVPVIAQTAYAMVEDKKKLLALGFDGYLAKPIQVNLLLETLSEFLFS
ncbi:MAG: response regulator [Bacteroidales bacterium]|nr:response regulator [Bacteroidales bacterium]